MKYSREKLDEVFEEIQPILEEHFHEISHYPDIELEPDWNLYYAIEAKNGLRVYSCRSDEGDLIGYSVYFLKHNLHYKSSYQAVQDVIYIQKDHRGAGRKFINWCDGQLKEEGVQVVYHHVKANFDWGPMLERMDYEKIDIVYGRRLDKWV